MTTVVAEDKGGLFTISGRQWLILLMVQLANMLFGMTITIANLVLPQMRGNLSATQDEISWVITLNLVATAVAIWGIGAVFGPVLGPILGSIATEAYDWRAAFFIIVPPGLCALVCIWFALRDHTARNPVRFDWTGFIALSVAVTCAQLIFDRGHRLDWFESTEMILFAFTGVVALWIFVVHCLTVAEPFVNPRLLLDRNFTIGILLALVMGMLNFTSIVLFPTLLHDLRGYPDNAIATLIAARGMGNWAAFLFIVQLTRIAPPFAIICGMGIQAAAGFLVAQWNINLTDSDVFWGNFLLGLGQSMAFTPMTVMAFSTLPPRQVTEGSAVFTLMRNFGSSLFISIAVLIVSRSTASNYSRMTEYITPYNKTLTEPGLPPQWSLDGAASLQTLSNEILRQAAMIGYLNAFYLMAFAALAAMPLAAFMRGVKRDP